MGKIISVYNLKGGCGKTATAVNLGHSLALSGKKVLIIDMDFQCNATSTLYGDIGSENECLYSIINPKADKTDIRKCIHVTTYENLYILPNIKKSLTLEPALIISAPEGFSRFRNRVRDYVSSAFDYTIFDNHPALGVFTIASLIVSDSAIIPIEAGSRYNIDGLSDAVDFFSEIKETYNKKLDSLKILITRMDRRIKSHNVTINHVRSALGDNFVFKTIIPTNADIQNAENIKKTVHAYRSNAKGAIAYNSLAKEIEASGG